MARILIADDDVDLVEVWTSALEEADHQVTACYDGNAAARLAFDNSYDIILTDIFMPGKNGYLVTQLARTCNDRVKIIAVSGKALDGAAGKVRDEAERAGAIHFLKKPVELDHLLTVIEQVGKLDSR